MDNKNINTKLTEALKERIDNTKELVDVVRKNHNEFVDYWAVCYSADSFNPYSLFSPYLRGRSLEFTPSELYNNFYNIGGPIGPESSSSYEWWSSGNTERLPNKDSFDIPAEFNDGLMSLSLTHGEIYGKNVLFIPTSVLVGKNEDFYETLKDFSPTTEGVKCFPNEYYTKSYGLVNRMRPEVTHAVVLWSSDENGDNDIEVRWVRNDLSSAYNTSMSNGFMTPCDVFDYLWDGFEIDPNCYYQGS